jgi:hypothetical protein
VNPFAKGEEDAVAFKFPLPYGYNVPFILGKKIGHMARPALGMKVKPGMTVWKAAADVLGAAVDAFNPVGGVSTLLQFITPTPIKPLAEIAENKNFAGQPVAPEQNPFAKIKKPDSQLYWSTASEQSKYVADWLNRMTGGNETRPGAVDISPETLDHFFGFLTGGLGSFASRSVNALEKWVNGEDIQWREVPFARRLIEGRNEWHDRQRYYEVRNEVEIFKAEVKAARAARNRAEIDRLTQKHTVERKMVRRLEITEHHLKRARSERRAIEKNPRLSEERKKELLEAIKARETKMMRNAIGAWNRLSDAD